MTTRRPRSFQKLESGNLFSLYLYAVMSRLESTQRNAFFASTLLCVWALVIGLEVHHQFGHVISGCTHHHHHGQAEHHHHDCKKWDGSHAQDQWRGHEHICSLCEWDFSPLSAPTKTTWDKQDALHAVQLVLGWTQEGFVTTTWQADWSRRGPPESA